ncbi:hypothetical protein ASPTUDRAFT_56125 [Aspergillus tubingensis CBS 134.48]|uniref:Uncharacterized protein n=1 Tax=Aspergillus tubingensis (strain CBS 134.48) TaxID=767770 RepID=A0A1L9N4C3_ASPTC|nr:hypothetical protein ASPTUDRAFT_56125 [Aspergillus tubingensis CBS 134.48]
MSKRRISETISPSPDPSPAVSPAAASAPAPAPKRRRMRRQHHRQYLSVDPPSPEDYYQASPTTTPVSPTIPPAPSSPPPPQPSPSPSSPPPLPPRTTPRYRHILPKPPPPAPTSTSTPKPPTHSPQPHPQPPKNHQKKRKSKLHPHLPPILHHLRTPLHPLVSSTTGHEHPDFPLSLLQYNLLTSDQLDRLAVHFHQVHPPVRGSFWYPVRIVPWLRWDGSDGKGGYVGDAEVGLEVKRRRFGRFIGLRGCEGDYPRGRRGRGRSGKGRREVVREEVEEGEIREEEVVDEEEVEEEEETAEEMLARMEREWFEAMVRARYEGEYAMRWKMGRG